MQVISEANSAALVSHAMAYEAVRAALIAAVRPDVVNFPVVHGHGTQVTDRFSIKSAASTELVGLKVGSYWPGNLALGRPRHNSLILLFDPSVGRIHAAVEGGVLNGYRTAAANAIATDALARPDATVLAVFGTGHQAAFDVAAIARIRPLQQVLVVGRDAERAQAFVKAIEHLGLPTSVRDAESACRDADIITTITPARAPLFEADWIRPGTHVSSMGSDAAGKQELPPALFGTGRLFCDLPLQSRAIGEFQHANEDAVLVGIGDVLAGAHPGRRTADEITVFDSSGLAVQDLFIAKALLALVNEADIARAT